MAIYTPNGLKIRLPVPYAFGLIARLFPKVSAFDVLKTTEGIEKFPSCATFIAAMVSFSMHFDPFQIALIIFITYILTISLNTFGLFIIPGQVTIGTLFNRISGYGFLMIVTVIVGYITTGWQGVVAYFSGRFIGWCLGRVIEFKETKRYHKLIGFPVITASERNFFNAYRIHASKHGITTNIELSEKEMEDENWHPAFDDLAMQWPEVVGRFTNTKI